MRLIVKNFVVKISPQSDTKTNWENVIKFPAPASCLKMFIYFFDTHYNPNQTHLTISSKNITLTQQLINTPKIANDAFKSISPNITDIKIKKIIVVKRERERVKICVNIKNTRVWRMKLQKF